MNIVLEGPDNSGKSTLARQIANATGRQVFSSEGPEKYPGELLERVERYSKLDGVIFDRHPFVSDIIYSRYRDRSSSLAGPNEELFYAEKPLFIYCDPLDRGFADHERKAHDSDDHLNMLTRHEHDLINDYRQWALQKATIWFRIGDDVERIIRFCLGEFDPVQDVQQFMDKFGQSYFGDPRVLPVDLSRFREDFMDEELSEYKKHARALESLLDEIPLDEAAITFHLNEMLDALVDKMYVDIGTALLHGFNNRIFRTAWNRVHQANMKKEKVARRSESTRHSIYDVRKPAGWEKPDHTDLVEGHAHRNSSGK